MRRAKKSGSEVDAAGLLGVGGGGTRRGGVLGDGGSRRGGRGRGGGLQRKRLRRERRVVRRRDGSELRE